MRRGGWYGVAVAGLIVVGAGIALREWPHATAGQFDPVGAVLSLAGLAVSVFGLWQATLAQRQADSDPVAAAARLAETVKQVETTALAQLLGGSNRAIDVHFAFRRAPGHDASGAQPRGTLTEVVEYYHALNPRRMVVTGAGGSGKTVLALQLILRLLDERAPEDPVPVRLSAATLDTQRPTETAVEAWLAAHLCQAPYQLPATAAERLVAARMVLPVLDGLDEMDADESPGYDSRSAQAVRAANAYLSGLDKGAMVITCRIGQYEALETTREWVQDAARIEIAPVGVAMARNFLTLRAVDSQRWEPVLAAMRRKNRPLATALSTPWRLTLAATVYEQRHPKSGRYLRDPIELTASTLDTEEKIRDHLLALFIPAKTSGVKPYSSTLVHVWLGTLARYLADNTAKEGPNATIGGRTLSGTDLVPHELWPLAGPRLTRVMSVLTIMLLFSALTAFLWSRASFRSSAYLSIELTCITLAGATLLAIGAWVSIWSQPSLLNLRSLRTLRGIGRFVLWGAIGGASGVAIGFTAGGHGVLPEHQYVGIISPSLGISIAIIQGTTNTLDWPARPLEAIQSELRSTMILGISAGATLAVALTIQNGLTVESPFVCAACCTGGMLFTFCVQTVTQRYLLFLLATRRWTNRWLPWRLGRFLDWSYRAGLLRIAGPAYQFRHRELQEYLAKHPVPV